MACGKGGRMPHRSGSTTTFLPGLRGWSTSSIAPVQVSIQLGHGGGHTRIDICGETDRPSHPASGLRYTFETILPER